MKAALTGVAVNVVLKIVLIGSLAQVGLALATAVGRVGQSAAGDGLRGARRLSRTRPSLVISLAKFAVAGVMLAAALWGTARFAGDLFRATARVPRRDALLLLIVAGAFVYGV